MYILSNRVTLSCQTPLLLSHLVIAFVRKKITWHDSQLKCWFSNFEFFKSEDFAILRFLRISTNLLQTVRPNFLVDAQIITNATSCLLLKYQQRKLLLWQWHALPNISGPPLIAIHRTNLNKFWAYYAVSLLRNIM